MVTVNDRSNAVEAMCASAKCFNNCGFVFVQISYCGTNKDGVSESGTYSFKQIDKDLINRYFAVICNRLEDDDCASFKVSLIADGEFKLQLEF